MTGLPFYRRDPLEGVPRHGALSRFAAYSTPQSEPLPGRESEMVRNPAGGYAFHKDLWTRLQDFIVLGTEGGTYYADEKSHTFANIRVLHEALAADGPRAVRLAVEISPARPARAPKNYPALFVVAVALASSGLPTRQAAADAVPLVARTTDHLAHLFGYYKNACGKPGRGGVGSAAVSSPVVRRAWANWFRSGPPDRVAFTILKGRQRKTGDGEQFHPGDLLRLARPVPRNEVESALFALAADTKGAIEVSGHLSAAKAFYEAQRSDTPALAVRAINFYHVPWEFLPDEVMKSPAVWEALIPYLGITALIRNLSRMTTLGVLGPFRAANGAVAQRLTDTETLHRGRVHPFDLMLALLVYQSGSAQPNPKAPRRTWTPVPEIVDALNRAYTASFGVCEPTPGSLVIAVDKSGSMGHPVSHGGSTLGSAYHVASAVAQILMRTWSGDTWPLEFDDRVSSSHLRADMSLSDVFRMGHHGGATDIAAPIRWARENHLAVDGFVIITDNETWAGSRHVSEELEMYRRALNPAARVAVLSTTSNGLTVNDPRDPGVVNMVGFDSAIPALLASWMSPKYAMPVGLVVSDEADR